jgi:hypothetical protein
MRRAESVLDRAAPLLLALAAAAYLLPLRSYGLSINDDGWWLQAVLRMRAGEILYRDIWSFYAPGIDHAIAWLFALTGPSLLAARTLFALLIVATVAMTYPLARRFAPSSLAWLPAAAYGLVPGPWHKAYYGTCTAAFFLVFARALERSTASRFAVAGAIAGLVLITRQDLGLAAIAITVFATALPAITATRFAGARDARRAAQLLAATLAAFAVPVGAVAAFYASNGALDDLVEATLVRAFGQMGAHPDSISRLVAPQTFGLAPQGRVVGALMLLPLVLYPVSGVLLLRCIRRDGLSSTNVLIGGLLAIACATLTQAYYPMLLLRFLQSALPCYLLATYALARGVTWLSARGIRYAVPTAVALGAGLVALLAEQVIFGIPAVRPPIYTGSARVLRCQNPVQILGETVTEEFGLAEEIRLVRGFYREHAAADEPTLGLPSLSLYNVLLERPNPTRFLAEHPAGDFVMTAAQKRVEADRLLASSARFVLVDQRWYARPGPADPLLAALRGEFHPVRGYGTVLILERGNDPAWRAFAERLRVALVRGPSPADVAPGRRFAADHPNEPIGHRMLGAALESSGNGAGAIDAYHRAADVDSADVTPLERSAALLAQAGRGTEARVDLERARRVRDSNALREVARRIGGDAIAP